MSGRLYETDRFRLSQARRRFRGIDEYHADAMRCPSCGRDVPESSRYCLACGAGLNVSASPTATATATGHLPSSEAIDGARFIPGTMVSGRYRIVGLLGRGGMGEVYRAEDLKLGQAVALKFLPIEVTHREDRLARFHQEVRLARQVSHPNVCRVHDIGETGGQTFLSMEYIDGEDLASLLRRIGRLPADKALEIARQLCAGLAAAHDRKVLHRDLKPANVLIDGRGQAHLADFGLADLSDQRRDAPDVAGTPGYMAPEQLDGRELTTRTDVYALGLVLYEMFTGKRALAVDGALLGGGGATAAPPKVPRRMFPTWIRRSNASSCGVSNATRDAARRRQTPSLRPCQEGTRSRRRLPPGKRRLPTWLRQPANRACCRRRSAPFALAVC